MKQNAQNRVNCVHVLRRLKSRIEGRVYLAVVADEARERLKAVDEEKEKNKVNVETSAEEEIEK